MHPEGENAPSAQPSANGDTWGPGLPMPPEDYNAPKGEPVPAPALFVPKAAHVQRSKVAGERAINAKTAKLFRRLARAYGLSEAGLKRLEVTYTSATADARAAIKRRLEQLIEAKAQAERARRTAEASPLHVDRDTIGRFLLTGEAPRPRAAILRR